MRADDLNALLEHASCPPAAPVDRFLATIPLATPRPVLRQPVLAGLLTAAGVAVAAGALMLAVSVPPAGRDTTPERLALSEDEAFAAALSGELLIDLYAADAPVTP